MKVVAINGSPRKNGNTAIVLKAMAEELEKEGINVETIQVGDQLIHGCIACEHCKKSEGNQCVFKDDIVNEASLKMREADGIILAAPTYYGGIPGTAKSFLDRVFYSSAAYFRYKAATAVSVVRRAGGVDVYRQLTNYLTLSETVTPPSQYWLTTYGRSEGEVTQDGEGIQTVRKNAKAMAWLLKVIEAGKKTFPVPPAEEKVRTSFIR
jgi:multimeric flavodoxin WrbA